MDLTAPLGASHPFVHLDIGKTIDMMGDEASAQPIVAMALETLSEEIAQMRELVGAGDLQGAGRVLHTVKGSLPLFAADALVAQVTWLEKACKTDPLPEYVTAFTPLLAALELLTSEIRTYLVRAAPHLQ